MFALLRHRNFRVLLWFAGFVVFALVATALARFEQGVDLPAHTVWLACVWGIGLVVLLFLNPSTLLAYRMRLTLVRVIWVNVGSVLLALISPAELRSLLLVLPLLGIGVAATRLDRLELIGCGLLAWCTALVGTAVLASASGMAAVTGWYVLAAFSISLAAAVVLGVEVGAMRRHLLNERQWLVDHLDKVQVAATRDELTGVFNRRFLNELLAREIAFADREDASLALCYCDLDHFKATNDRYGHAAGDAVLKAFAELAGTLVRSVDYVARLGGEEFLLVLVGANARRGLQVAERLCRRTRALRTPAIADASFVQTVSCGVVQYRQGEGAELLLERADRALYAAKRGGRNRVVMA
ncbi:MAG: GGDEF domain-containing protein [Pseudomonadales bacterium]